MSAAIHNGQQLVTPAAVRLDGLFGQMLAANRGDGFPSAISRIWG